MEKIKCALFLRLSTNEQITQTESMEHHKYAGLEYAKMRGYEVVKIYKLEGVSGSKVLEYPVTQEMLQDVKSGVFNILIFSKLSRLGRSLRQLLTISDIFKSCNAHLVSIHENLDSSSIAGDMMFNLISIFSEYEKNTIVDRVKNATLVRNKIGKKITRAQFGYRWNEDTLELHPEESIIRKKMFTLFLEHKKLKTVCRELESQGYRARNNKKLYPQSVKKWLSDEIAIGKRKANYTQSTLNNSSKLKPKEEWIFHKAPRLVSDDVFYAVQKILHENSLRVTPRTNRKVHVYTGFIFCFCKSRLNVRSRLTHYMCKNPNCKNKIRRDELDLAFRSQLQLFLNDKKQLSDYFKQATNKYDDKYREIEVATKELNKIQSELDNLLLLHQKEQLPTEAFNEYFNPKYKQSKQLRETIENLKTELNSLAIEKKSADNIINDSKAIYSKWDSYSRDKKREIVESIIDTIVIGKDSIDFNLKSLIPQKASFLELDKNGVSKDYRPFYRQ